MLLLLFPKFERWVRGNNLLWCDCCWWYNSLVQVVVVVVVVVAGGGKVRAMCWHVSIIDVAVTMISWIVEFMLDIAMEVDSGWLWFGERITVSIRVCTWLSLSFRTERLKRRELEGDEPAADPAIPNSTEGTDVISSVTGNICRPNWWPLWKPCTVVALEIIGLIWLFQ